LSGGTITGGRRDGEVLAALVGPIDRLSEWIDWVSSRYQLDYKTIPACWSEHGSLIEELSGLYTLWQGCFEGDAAPPNPITFHRELEGALRRLREWNSRSGCTRTVHRPDLDS
jgi:hypothetical protein